MTELKLPEELEDQAILHALGILNQDDRRTFMVRLQGESDLWRQATTAYQAARYLEDKTPHIITNSLPVANHFAGANRLEVLLEALFVCGAQALLQVGAVGQGAVEHAGLDLE